MTGLGSGTRVPALRPSGEMLRAHRMNAGMTQAELAEKAGLHVTYVSALERGRKQGGVRGWKKLADALGVEVMDFMVGHIEKTA